MNSVTLLFVNSVFLLQTTAFMCSWTWLGNLIANLKKKSFQRDLTDFEKHIPPKYQEIISDIQVKTCFLKKTLKKYQKLSTHKEKFSTEK